MAAKKTKVKAKSKAKSKATSRAAGASRPAPKARSDERDLLARLNRGAVICAEGYVFELERRGYLQAGAFVPEVLFDHPEGVEQLHLDFVPARADVTQALPH